MKSVLGSTDRPATLRAQLAEIDRPRFSGPERQGDPLEILSRTEWWQHFAPEEQRAFRSICSPPIPITAKSDLGRSGQRPDQIFFVIDGWFARNRETSERLRQTLSMSLAGECLNPEALYLDSTTIRLAALTDGSVIAIEKADLRDQIAQHPHIGLTFQRFLARNNLLLSEETARLGRRTARERLAHFICEITTRLDRMSPPDHYGHRVPLTQEQVADALGLTVVHVNRTLQDLRAMKLLEWRAQRLQVLDWPKLSKIADFDPSYLRASSTDVRRGPGEKRLPQVQLRELQHRFKNLVAVVNSLVSQTLTDQAEIGVARTTLMARLDALGKSIDLLSPSGWQHGSLKEVVRRTLKLSGEDARISYEGPDLTLDGRAISTLAMALHELQTNAMKYGALSHPGGTVTLFWKAVEAQGGHKLWMQWSEKGGPQVKRKPAAGFGTQLLTTVTPQNLSGETILDYDRDGLNWLLIAPLDKIVAGPDSRPF
jgi:two-component sensor histidine kinase